ncbi:MAG: hypothetical protein PHE86_01145 [Candidatus Marinimicrobia bacterium]|nr:hypothetical protein [Candidatus Neomarinimicrobiota bacterium]MDD5581599.1 hypothetical protein [Candidatus Neomarinimicrobiota bacterium]
MNDYDEKISHSIHKFSDILDISEVVWHIAKKSKIHERFTYVFIIDSIASVSSIEFELVHVQDTKDMVDTLIPKTVHSCHSETWGNDKWFSYLCTTWIGLC